MITSLRPHDAYKPSGVSWLGKVPKHWNILPGRVCFREKSISNGGLKEQTVLSLSFGQIVVKPVEKLHGLVPASFETYQIVDPGDIIIRPTDLQNDWNSLRFGLSRYRGIITSAYICFHSNDFLVREYGYLLLHAYDLKKVFYGLGSGLRQNLDWKDFKYLPCLVPPESEQSSIVNFLNIADKNIRRFVQNKRRLIKLLNEQKQAVINIVVTRGLHSLESQSSVQKAGPEHHNQSSIPWLGLIPDHWNILPSKRLFSVRKELAQPGDVQLSATQAYGVIPQDEFEQKVGRRVVKISMHLEKRRHVEKDDFVISMRSFQGGLERSWASGCIRSSYVVLKPGPHVNVDYFAYLFKSHDYILALRATANFIRDGQDLSFSNFCLVDLPAVPPDEQKAIATYLDRATRSINVAIDRAHEEIKLIHEYSTRLIADVVTGKLDVREAAERLPSSAEQEAPDDEHLDLAALDPEEADGLDDDPDLLPVAEE